MEIQGRIRAIMPARSGVSQATGNSWMSQEYVLDYFWWPNQTQPSQMLFRVFGEDRIKQWNLQVNDEVKLTYHIEAHEYEGRWFNEIQCTNCQKVGASAQQTTSNIQQDGGTGAAPAAAEPGTAATQTPIMNIEGKDDDLPF